MQCPKCGSENVNIQFLENGKAGTSKTTYYKKSHGCLYFLLIGWWIWIFKIMLLPITIWFGKKKKVGYSTTVSGTKNLNQKVALCQNCGNSWEIK